VKVFQQFKAPPAPEKYPYVWRWYNHILTWESEFSSLPGDPTKEFSAYGPESAELTLNPAKAPEKEAAAEEDDDEVDLFGSSDEEEDAENERLKAERLAEYNIKKAGKVKPAAKSIVTLDVKPWGMCSQLMPSSYNILIHSPDDETDMKELEASVRSIEKEGLVWGGSKLVPVGFGIKKLQINVVIEDNLVSLDDLQQQIEGFEDFVQSTDVAAMQKL
jgi:elongation factor 1-beta